MGAELSAQKKECMMNKLRTLQDNMAATTETLTKTQERIEKQEQVRAMVNSMKDKVSKYELKIKMQAQNSQQLGMLGNVMPDFDFPEPLINYDEEEETEAQKDPEIESQVEPVGAQKVEEEVEPQQQIQQNPADHESDPHCDLNESVQRLESKYAEARSEESMDIDLNDSVQRLEAKCAGVREELGRMALSEQYMRTKQAQLRARKKELEAKEATIKAELREKEAYD